MNNLKKKYNKKFSDIFGSGYFLTDGGLETTMIYHYNVQLPHFAAFEMIYSNHGRLLLKNYHRHYMEVAYRYDLTYILETPTWRANSDWGFKLGYDRNELNKTNRHAVLFMREIQNSSSLEKHKMLISGCVGPRGDGYIASKRMTTKEALDYHNDQIRTFALADVDVITAMTINYVEEAIGIALAARVLGVPVVISFTVETDGNLPGGESLESAITQVDAATNHYVEHFMINCAHPEHFNNVLKGNGRWKNRIRGIRANASTKSHAELDASTSLDTGNKFLLGREYVDLRKLLPAFGVIGGCCGTDHTHLNEICQQLFHERGNVQTSLSA